jgi:hypothetical protein
LASAPCVVLPTPSHGRLSQGGRRLLRVVAQDGNGAKMAYRFLLRGGDVVRHFAEESAAEADHNLLGEFRAALK